MLLLAPLAAAGVAAGTLMWVPGAPSGHAGINNVRWPALAAPASATAKPTKPAVKATTVELTVHDVIPIEEANTHAVVLVSSDGEAILPLFVTEEAAVSIAFRLAQQNSPHPLASRQEIDKLREKMGIGGSGQDPLAPPAGKKEKGQKTPDELEPEQGGKPPIRL
jgi:hypothetical protein